MVVSVCHLVIELFPCRTSFIEHSVHLFWPHLPTLTWITGNQPVAVPLCSAQTAQAEGISLNCFSLLISLGTFFLPLFLFLLYYLHLLYYLQPL